MNSGPWGNRRLTVAASCLSCFVKAANLPFVTADSGDKRERKWTLQCWEQDQVRRRRNETGVLELPHSHAPPGTSCVCLCLMGLDSSFQAH